MVSEIQLFVDNIKPALLLSEKIYEKNKDILKNYRVKKMLYGGYLIYREEKHIEGKAIGEILGYPPVCVKTFEEKKKIKEQPEVKTSYFMNYGGIIFNCYEHFEEALEWCNNQYKDKMLSKYGKIDVILKEMEFRKNYTEGYTGYLKKLKRFEILA